MRVGERGESAAAEYLVSLGYTVKERNFRTSTGEIDLIADDGGRTVFIEVKARTVTANSKFGRPASAVDLRKRKRFASAVKAYQSLHPETNKCRIDVIEVYFKGENAEIKHIKSAFGDGGQIF